MLLREFAAEYQNAKAAAEEWRLILAEACRHAKEHGLTPAEISRITGWSRSQVTIITRDSDKTPTAQAVNTDTANEETTDGEDG